MPNKTHALEWIQKAQHDLRGARILYEAGHYTDTISYVLQQSLEKLLKSFLAHNNGPIPKSHNLIELYELLGGEIELEEGQLRLLAIATTYSTKQRYPSPHKFLPSYEEIHEVLQFAEELFVRVCKILDIDPAEVKQ